MFFFFNDTATTEIYTLSLHDALPIFSHGQQRRLEVGMALAARPKAIFLDEPTSGMGIDDLDEMKRLRSEEHTSELQSLAYLVCPPLLEKKNYCSASPTALCRCSTHRP